MMLSSKYLHAKRTQLGSDDFFFFFFFVGDKKNKIQDLARNLSFQRKCHA